MIVLDNLAYQHADEWAKYGFGVIDAVGKVDLKLDPSSKIVICRLIPGIDPEVQLYNEMEGADAALLPPKLVREKIEGIESEGTIADIITRINTQAQPVPEFGKPNEEKQEPQAAVDVDEPFL